MRSGVFARFQTIFEQIARRTGKFLKKNKKKKYENEKVG